LFFFQAEDGIRDLIVTGVQTCALPISFDLKKMTDSANAAVDKASESADAGINKASETANDGG